MKTPLRAVVGFEILGMEAYPRTRSYLLILQTYAIHPKYKQFYSPTFANASINTRSDKYIPDWRSRYRSSRAEEMCPRCFAINTKPRVPRTGILKAAAQRLPAKSSMIASEPSCALAHASTEDSPGPNPHA